MIIVITFFFFEHLPLVKYFAHTLCTQFPFIAFLKKCNYLKRYFKNGSTVVRFINEETEIQDIARTR